MCVAHDLPYVCLSAFAVENRAAGGTDRGVSAPNDETLAAFPGGAGRTAVVAEHKSGV